MKTASQGFSTIALNLFEIFFSKWVPTPIKGSVQVSTELTLEAFYTY